MATFPTIGETETTPDDLSHVAAAAEARVHRILTSVDQSPHPNIHVTLRTEGGAEELIELPVAALRLLHDSLGQTRGATVALVSSDAELTTQQAAELLRVSRPYLIQLLESGKLPYRRVGTHRRVRYADVEAYQRAEDARRVEALHELTAQAQELGLGY